MESHRNGSLLSSNLSHLIFIGFACRTLWPVIWIFQYWKKRSIPNISLILLPVFLKKKSYFPYRKENMVLFVVVCRMSGCSFSLALVFFFALILSKYSKIYSFFLIAAAPQRPKIEHEGIQVPPGHNVTVDSKAVATVSCVSHYGNPAATLKWFLGKCKLTIRNVMARAYSTSLSLSFVETASIAVAYTRSHTRIRIYCKTFP